MKPCKDCEHEKMCAKAGACMMKEKKKKTKRPAKAGVAVVMLVEGKKKK